MAKYCPYCVSRIESGDTCPYCNFSYIYKIKPHHLRPGTLLNNKYLIGRVLGEGGFGITYLGRDLTLDMKVAIKEYYPAGSASRISNQSTAVSLVDWTRSHDYDKGRAQFIHEAQTIAKMDKESAVVTVRDFFEMNNSAYIVMEFIEGQDLRDIIAAENKPIDKKKLLPLLEPIFAALTEMHKIGLIHRDISPDNIMVENGMARLIDFGCTTKTVDLSNADKVLKHSFSPIEQYHNSDMGPWSDVYAMAATIYYCLTGKLPPNALERAQKDTLTAPSVLGIKLLPKQEKALMKALSVEQNDRFQSIEEFGKAFFVHTNLYKYIAIAACALSVLAAAALMLFKPEAKVEALSFVDQPTVVVLTVEDSLSSDERVVLEKVTELASSTSISIDDYSETISFTNDTGYTFEYFDLDIRHFDDAGVRASSVYCQFINVEAGKTYKKEAYSGSNLNNVEIKITYSYLEKVYQTDYVPLSLIEDHVSVQKAIINVANTPPQSLTYTGYSSRYTYSVTEISCLADTFGISIDVSGTVVSGEGNSAGVLDYQITDGSGAVVYTNMLDMGHLREGDSFVASEDIYPDLIAGETYYLELLNHVN